MKPFDSTVFAKRVRYLLPVLIALAVVVAFWPSLYAEFVHWDDDAHFLNNVHFRGLDWPNLREKLPMLAVAIGAGLVSVVARHSTAVLSQTMPLPTTTSAWP